MSFIVDRVESKKFPSPSHRFFQFSVFPVNRVNNMNFFFFEYDLNSLKSAVVRTDVVSIVWIINQNASVIDDNSMC